MLIIYTVFHSFMDIFTRIDVKYRHFWHTWLYDESNNATNTNYAMVGEGGA